jgi:ribonuclease HI
MRLAALEAIYSLYREEEWLHIYTDGSLTEKNGNVRAGIYFKMFSFYLSLGQHSTHFDGEIEAMNTALMQLFGRIGSFGKAVIFSDSSAAIQLIANFDALPSKRVPEIHSSIKLLQGPQKDIKFQWIPSPCGVMGNEMADYFAKKGTKISETSACKLTFHSAKSKIKGSIQVDLSVYYAIQSQHKSWNKIVENKNIVPDFPRGDAVVTFQLITGCDCLAAHLYRVSLYPSPACVLCREENSIMNQDHCQKCTVSDTENTPIAKLYWNARPPPPPPPPPPLLLLIMFSKQKKVCLPPSPLPAPPCQLVCVTLFPYCIFQSNVI